MSLPMYIAELNGYLKSLSFLNGPSCQFGVKWYDFDEGVESFVNKFDHGYSFSGYARIDFDEIKERLLQFTLNGFLSRERFSGEKSFNYFKEMMVENINEYYGLASTMENKEGVFHPLIKSPVYELTVCGEGESVCFYFLVKIESFYVLTFFKNPNRM